MADRYTSEILAVITATESDGTPATVTLRAALFGGMYADPDNPTGDLVHYNGRIKSDIVLTKSIGIEFWKEDSAIDFGYLDIALEDQDDDLIDWAEKVWVAKVELYRVNASDNNALEILATARTSDIGFDDEHSLRLRLESILQDGFVAPINELYYDYDVPHLQGKPYPIAWGLITDPYQLLPTLEVDPAWLEYHVTDLEIDSFESYVYDRGIALLPTTQFTPTTYGFQLLQNPVGAITCGRILALDPEGTAGSHMHGLFRFVRLAMTRAGIWAYANQTELAQLEEDIGFGDLFPQFFTMDVVALDEFLRYILQGVTGWYYVDELTEIHFGRMVDPDDATPVFAFTDSNVSGSIKVEDDKAPGLTDRLSYAQNPGAYDVDGVAGGVYGEDRVVITTKERIATVKGYWRTLKWTADSVDWTADNETYTADGYAGEVWVNPRTISYWSNVSSREPVILPIAYSNDTNAFDLASGELQRWWEELYYKRRRFYTFDVKLNDEQFNLAKPQLGDFCTLQSDRFKLLTYPRNLFIRRLKFNFSKNLLTVEAWG